MLTDLGFLWQVGTIDPCHERFVSEMIKQKIVVHIEKEYDSNTLQEPPTFVLFLPHSEVHDIGLLYANYLCIQAGINTIYLGSNIDITSLSEVTNHHDNIIFLTYLTVAPADTSVLEYCNTFNLHFGKKNKHSLWLTGSKIKPYSEEEVPKNVTLLHSISELQKALKILKKSQS